VEEGLRFAYFLMEDEVKVCLITKGGTVINYFYHSTLADIESVKKSAKELYLEFLDKQSEELTEAELQQLNPENWKEI